MSVTHSPRGFTGTVDEIAEANRWWLGAPPFRAGSVNAWAVTADVSVNRQVDIAVGSGIAYGVADTTTQPDALALAANNGTTDRYDAIVASWSWQTHRVTFAVIPGTTSPPQVNVTTTADPNKINRIPGVQYDALLAVVRVRSGVGVLSAGDVVDCRMWAGFDGYANVVSAQYLTMLDTFPGSLVHDVTTDIVWNRLANGVWGFEKWIGTDKSKQPMIALRNTSLLTHQGVGVNVNWPDVTDHGGGLLSLSGDTIVCNVPGRVRIESLFVSDMGDAGYSWISVSLPAGGGNYLSNLDDLRQRNSGYSGAGTLRQTPTVGPIQVRPGDLIGATVFQLNTGAGDCVYQAYLSATYV
jgi:hypothetical protein